MHRCPECRGCRKGMTPEQVEFERVGREFRFESVNIQDLTQRIIDVIRNTDPSSRIVFHNPGTNLEELRQQHADTLRGERPTVYYSLNIQGNLRESLEQAVREQLEL